MNDKGNTMVFKRYEPLGETMSEETKSSQELLEIYEEALKQADADLRGFTINNSGYLERQLDYVKKIIDLQTKIQEVKFRLKK